MSDVNSLPNSLGHRIGTEIRVLMIRQNKRQIELAEVLGVTQGAISRYLAGERPLALDDLEKIARFLEIPIAELMASAA